MKYRIINELYISHLRSSLDKCGESHPQTTGHLHDCLLIRELLNRVFVFLFVSKTHEDQLIRHGEGLCFISIEGVPIGDETTDL